VRARIALALLPLALVSYALALEPAAIAPFSSAEAGRGAASRMDPSHAADPQGARVHAGARRRRDRASRAFAGRGGAPRPIASTRMRARTAGSHGAGRSIIPSPRRASALARATISPHASMCSFDVPRCRSRWCSAPKMKLAKLVYGADLPAAAICYVWDNHQPIGTNAWNPYTDRLRMVVLESGNARAGEWVGESPPTSKPISARRSAPRGTGRCPRSTASRSRRTRTRPLETVKRVVR